jgi:alpha-L-fucosidase
MSIPHTPYIVLSVSLTLLGLGSGGVARPQDEAAARNVAIIRPGDSAEDIVRAAANVVPSDRQRAWQELEFIAFIHFGMNTFTDREWGLGTEDPSLFNPTDLDARQWVRVCWDAGMKMVVVTAKHHDGFCLWPTAYTRHSVRSSPWRGGNGDVVGDVAAACREFGLKFGVYLSPWDKHEPTYGDSPKYNEHFRHQLRELLTKYGSVSEVWFDGACGEGPNGRKQEYDWQSYYRLIRELAPEAVIAIMGPDVRWVGTESGYGRETEWSVVPDVLQDPDATAERSQQHPGDGAFVPRDLTQEDLGSRKMIENARALVWYPAETDVSIRPGWFYHAEQDDQVKTPEKLVDIYYSSVGRNSVLLLNLPPDKRGRIHDHDIRNLMGMRTILDQTFGKDLVDGATSQASSARKGHPPALTTDGDNSTFWMPEEGVESASVEWSFPDARTFDRAMLQECVSVGQRVEKFHLDVWDGADWSLVAAGTTIGYKRLLRFPAVSTRRVRLVIEESRTSPTLSRFGLFKAPPRVTVEPNGAGFEDSITVRLSADVKGVPIYYTLDGSAPTLRSRKYVAPIVVNTAATLKAVAGCSGEPCLEVTEAQFIRCLRVRSLSLEKPASPRYPGEGEMTLVNGKRAPLDFNSKEWLGFERDDMVATLDLGSPRPMTKVTATFLQQQGSWIFLPSRVTFAVSSDGTGWRELADIAQPVDRTEKVLAKDFVCQTPGATARYVRVVARNVGTCPSWHAGAGEHAWLFADEIIIE